MILREVIEALSRTSTIRGRGRYQGSADPGEPTMLRQPQTRSMRDIVGRPELLNVRLTVGDAYMIQSWIQEALSELCPNNDALRGAVANYKKAFDDAARESLTPRSVRGAALG